LTGQSTLCAIIFNNFLSFDFKATDTFVLPPKKNKSINFKDKNEGIMRSNWLKKRLEIVKYEFL